MNTSAAVAIANAITLQEGSGPGTLATRNNNPGNLRFVGQAGAVQGAGGFAAFPSYAAGQAALIAQIQLDASRGTDAAGRPINTVADLISSWAPAGDGNDTAAYIASVAAQTGFSPDDALDSLGGGGGGGAVSMDMSALLPDGSLDLSSGAAGLLDTITSQGPVVEIAAGVGAAVALWMLLRLVG
jgi:hypothetical protein